ncbi:MAG: hypothetical protein ACOJUL_11070 [Candidatus Pollutiaquabacter aromativorans]
MSIIGHAIPEGVPWNVFRDGNADEDACCKARYRIKIIGEHNTHTLLASGPVFSRHVNVRPLISQIRDEITRG